MSKRTSHYDRCPAGDDPGAACVCEVLDDDLVQAETRMTLADMIRAAQETGHIKKGMAAYATV